MFRQLTCCFSAAERISAERAFFEYYLLFPRFESVRNLNSVSCLPASHQQERYVLNRFKNVIVCAGAILYIKQKLFYQRL